MFEFRFSYKLIIANTNIKYRYSIFNLRSDNQFIKQQIMTEPDKQKNNEDGIDIQQSYGMDEAEQQLFLNVRRSKSDDSFLGQLLLNKSEIQKRPLILDVNCDTNNNNGTGFRVFKKIKKERKKNLSDYRKNICGYITKKIIREFVSPNYFHFVKQLCQKHQCDYSKMKSYYLSKIERVTGPSHIPGLLIPENQEQAEIKIVFKDFFQWFLRERYLRYLLIQGKMSDKKAYIQYKNNVLMGMLRQTETGSFDFRDLKNDEDQDQQYQQDEQQQVQPTSDKNNELKPKKRSDIKIKLDNAKGIAKSEQMQRVQKKRQKLIPRIPIVKKECVYGPQL